MSPCNCGGAQTVSKFRWLYTSPAGKTTEYTSELQARAAQIRDKNSTGKVGTYQKVPA